MRVLAVAAGGLVGGLGWLSGALAQDIQVEDAWARASIGHVMNSAAYFTVENGGSQSDRLISVDSQAAERSELHNHVMEDDVARMVEVEAIDIPAGGAVALEPGGLHVMLIGLAEPLQPGDKVPLTLHFEQAESLDIEAEVRALGARDPHGEHTHDQDHGHEHEHEKDAGHGQGHDH
ncbi:MAG TPA: copper chaperone PCu(A)C [Kiloniellales bacterium]|nr:copper chaperone PCu(A)C [Kiloniellales bacterium]